MTRAVPAWSTGALKLRPQPKPVQTSLRRSSPADGAVLDDSDAVVTPGMRQIISVADMLPTPDPGHRRKEGNRMGIVLFPGDDDVTSPDISWSYTGFNMFRKWLAQAEGFGLSEMRRFGGDRAWNSVSTTLAPILDHPDDDGPDLTPAQCATIQPRLEAIIDQREHDGSDPIVQRRLEDTRQLVEVMKFCLDKDVELVFG
ncbi:hypothetical protein ACFXI8_32355 [Streptomyces niveus]|uniref:hypothetical protein n=1 Tax=Streptomyces niveus TaxID=193462 RepID=UPI00369CD764